MGRSLYKVMPKAIWTTAVQSGVFRGSGIDHEDGYIHLSARDQVVETVAKHFAGQTDLVLAVVDEDDLGETLKWEPSRGGELFPHVYGAIATDRFREDWELQLDEENSHVFPKGWDSTE